MPACLSTRLPCCAVPRRAVLFCPAGTREGVRFLKEHGIPLPLAQRIAQRLGQHTVERVTVDPYASLAGLGLPFRCVLLVSVQPLCDEVAALPGTGSCAAALSCCPVLCFDSRASWCGAHTAPCHSASSFLQQG
jgi:hypothetical protein